MVFCTLLALGYLTLAKENGALSFNLGSGLGFFVQEVIDIVKNVVNEDGFSLVAYEGYRREGYPAVLIVDAQKAVEVSSI